MNMIEKLDDLLGKLNTISAEGIPIKHEVEAKTVNEIGLWMLGGLLLAGIAAGTVTGLILSRMRQ